MAVKKKRDVVLLLVGVPVHTVVREAVVTKVMAMRLVCVAWTRLLGPQNNRQLNKLPQQLHLQSSWPHNKLSMTLITSLPLVGQVIITGSLLVLVLHLLYHHHLLLLQVPPQDSLTALWQQVQQQRLLLLRMLVPLLPTTRRRLRQLPHPQYLLAVHRLEQTREEMLLLLRNLLKERKRQKKKRKTLAFLLVWCGGLHTSQQS